MYFSKNSRYVLNRAKCMSPTFCFFDCLKGTTKNLCVKPPKDDPTKPPLRLNIPDESTRQQDVSSGSIQNQSRVNKRDITQPRSKSLLSHSNNQQSISPIDISVSRSESDTKLSNYQFETLQNNSDLDSVSASEYLSPNQTINTPTREDGDDWSSSRIDSSDKLRKYELRSSTIDQQHVEESAPSKFDNPSDGQHGSIHGDDSYESKALYVIVDVPEKPENTEISSSLSATDSKDNSTATFLKLNIDSSNSDFSSNLPLKVPKLEWQGNENAIINMLRGRSKSLPNYLYRTEGKQKQKIKFKVHEIDEAATYIFHLRFKKNFPGKSCIVGCVSEKELDARTYTVIESQGHVSDSAITGTPEMGKEISAAEEPTEPVKYENPSAQYRSKREKKDSEKKKSKLTKNLNNSRGSDTVKVKSKDRDRHKYASRKEIAQPPSNTATIEQPVAPETTEEEPKYFTYPKFSKTSSATDIHYKYLTPNYQQIVEHEQQYESEAGYENAQHYNYPSTETVQSAEPAKPEYYQYPQKPSETADAKVEGAQANEQESNYELNKKEYNRYEQGTHTQEQESASTIPEIKSKYEKHGADHPVVHKKYKNKPAQQIVEPLTHVAKPEHTTKGPRELAEQPITIEKKQTKHDQGLGKNTEFLESYKHSGNTFIKQSAVNEQSVRDQKQPSSSTPLSEKSSLGKSEKTTPKQVSASSLNDKSALEKDEETAQKKIAASISLPDKSSLGKSEKTAQKQVSASSLYDKSTLGKGDETAQKKVTASTFPSDKSSLGKSEKTTQKQVLEPAEKSNQDKGETSVITPITENKKGGPPEQPLDPHKIANIKETMQRLGDVASRNQTQQHKDTEKITGKPESKTSDKPNQQKASKSSESDKYYTVQYHQEEFKESSETNQTPGGIKSPLTKIKKPDRGGSKNDPTRGGKGGFKVAKSSDNTKREVKDPVNFQTSAGVVKISSETSCYPVKFCAAYPPTLNDVIVSRVKSCGLRKCDSLLHSNLHKINFQADEYEKHGSQDDEVKRLSENSILFPKPEGSNFDCDSIFNCNPTKGSTNVINGSEEKLPKISDNFVNVANEKLTESKGKPSVDSLMLMKKVKEIVNFDLNNAVKIFEGREADSKPITSVLLLKDGVWQVDEATLKSCTKGYTDDKCDLDHGRPTKIHKRHKSPIYLPGRDSNATVVKLNSVVTYNQTCKSFGINQADLDKAVEISNNNFELLHSLSAASKDNGTYEKECKTAFDRCKDRMWSPNLELKCGDSILVFDELTQTWKVDYSILEKRKEQQRQEEELTRRSEIILENIEKLERSNISPIRIPTSREKKTFDYTSEKWKAYTNDDSDQPTKSHVTSKQESFKESNAEEIRKKNSDLYENLFVINKKETKGREEGKQAPGNKTLNPKKLMAKASNSESKEPEKPIQDSKVPPKEKIVENSISQKTPPDDNYWESFLKLNILPYDRPQPPKPTQIPVTPPLPPPIGDKKPEVPKVKVPPPSNQQKKIDEPKFKLPFPFHREKKIDPTKKPSGDKKEMPKGNTKQDTPPLPKTPPPPATTGAIKKDQVSKTPPAAPITPKPEQPKNAPKTSKTDPLPIKPSLKKIDSPPNTNKEHGSKLDIPSIPGKKPEVKSNTEPKTLPKQESSSSNAESSPTNSSLNPGVPPVVQAPGKITPLEAPPSPSKSRDSEKTKKDESSPPVRAPPPAPPQSRVDPREKTPPTIGAPINDKPGVKVLKESDSGEKGDVKTKSVAGKKEKAPSDHYISENIVEMSKNVAKDVNSKGKSKKGETVKVNISPDKRVPSKITEINLNKKIDGAEWETTTKKQNSKEKRKSSEELLKKSDKTQTENKMFYKNFEKYKTPFSDLEYEEKSMKIKSDIESNPNLKKLDNWNKTLVLHDVGKSQENIESWLKDETDKMATLLLKVLQEAAEGKPKRKPGTAKGKCCEKSPIKGNPYDSIRKKQETTPEGLMFKMRSMNLALEAEKKVKQSKMKEEQPNVKDIPVQSASTVKPPRVIDAIKVSSTKRFTQQKIYTESKNPSNVSFNEPKPKQADLSLEPIEPTLRELTQPKLVSELTDDIPGPEILKKISNTWKLLPAIGCQLTVFTLLRMFQLVNLGTSFFSSNNPDKTRRHAFGKLFLKYGPIVNLQGPLSGNVILIHRPEHLMAVFDQDSLSPTRSVFDSLDQSRRDVEDKVVASGLSTDWTKSDWNNLKKASFEPTVRTCENFLTPVELAADSLVNTVFRNKNGQNLASEDFMDEIKRWSLEGLCSVLFARSLGFLENRSSNMNWLLEPDKLSLAVEEALECLLKCERGFQIWRLMSTPSLAGLGQAYRTLSTILSKQLYQAELNLKNKNQSVKENSLANSVELSFIESMLLSDGMTAEEVTCNLVDILLVGTSALSSALGFLLYNLSNNIKVQKKLFNEIKEILPEKSSRLNYNKLQSQKYLQACLKESLRLNTPFPLFFRLLQNDILLSNYVVPKGTYVVMDSRVSCMKEQVFDEPDKFIPERWLTEDKWMHNAHSFSSFPLCHGPKSELIKRVVEMQLSSCAAKLVRNFEVEYHLGEVLGMDNVISLPDKPLKFNFIERTS
ncbi:hypothetical protein RUM43_011480 [Polyplax serrata]|uniref:Uncharacterized protein n=1 Tax=Polyplax serrata TaxID=468196 RepID=A0AAN8NM44_POLSC